MPHCDIGLRNPKSVLVGASDLKRGAFAKRGAEEAAEEGLVGMSRAKREVLIDPEVTDNAQLRSRPPRPQIGARGRE